VDSHSDESEGDDSSGTAREKAVESQRSLEQDRRIALLADIRVAGSDANLDLTASFFRTVLLNETFVRRYYGRWGCYLNVLLEGGWPWNETDEDKKMQRDATHCRPAPSPFRARWEAVRKKGRRKPSGIVMQDSDEEEDEEYTPVAAAAAASSSSSSSSRPLRLSELATEVARRQTAESDPSAVRKFVETEDAKEHRKAAIQALVDNYHKDPEKNMSPEQCPIPPPAPGPDPDPSGNSYKLHEIQKEACRDMLLHRDAAYWVDYRRNAMRYACEILKEPEEQIYADFNPTRCRPDPTIRVTDTSKKNRMVVEFTKMVETGLQEGVHNVYLRTAAIWGEPGQGKTHNPQV
jgi:hypothetical protein